MDEIAHPRTEARRTESATPGPQSPAAARNDTGPRWISALLWTLAAFDLGLALTAFTAPAWWFDIMHGAPYVDPQGLLPRTGATWAMFALLQATAALRWRQEPAWLFAIAALRASDMATDWTYVGASSQLSSVGSVLLTGASPANLALAVVLWACWKKRTHSVSAAR
ncbi:hypothetical protein [Streptomyces sp. NPDC048639]|uniref:hypothetical protein n=1 Tax=Streptomyces sp. NPDC048639 TaxID=3365581 RepID=UPI00371D12B7